MRHLLSDAAVGGALDPGLAADPVAAVLQAHADGRLLALSTSGSTGHPRRVVRTTVSWSRSFPTVAELIGLGPASRLWLPGPLGATMNLFAATLARAQRAVVVDRVEDATHAQLTPTALAGALDDGLPLAGVHVTVAGDRLSRSLRDRARAAGAEVDHYYGASELSFVAWGSCEGDLRPFPGVEVEVREGEIWVRSPFVCEGYDGPPGALRRDGDGFATVGDRGVLRDGVLRVAGRGSEAVTTAGATVLVADVERVLDSAATGGVAVVGLPHPRLGQVVSAVLTEPGDLGPTRAAARQLEPAHRPRQWFGVPALPLTSAGKVDRVALVDRLLSGEVPRLGPGTAPR